MCYIRMVTRFTFHETDRSCVAEILLAAALALGLLLAGVAAAPAVASAASVEDLVRVRCATDGHDTFFVFSGTVHALGLEPRPRHLFDLVGMNVARCGRNADGGWYLTSRELMLYVDPATGRRLDRWTSPYTGEKLPVVHVANSPVQAPRLGAPHLDHAGSVATFSIDVFPTYPSPLRANADLRRFSAGDTYASSESFTFSFEARALGRTSPSVTDVALGWHRVGPALPWMALGERPGVLVYHARGRRVATLAELPAILRDEISVRLPRFARAPRCLLEQPNQTSWTYFLEHLDAYRRGERFPRPAPEDPTERCAAPVPRAGNAGK